MSEIGKEIRLDLMIKGTRKTFTQSHVPYSKALDYTDGEAKLFKKDSKGKEIAPASRELTEFRAEFVAGLFDDKDLTGAVLLDGIDTWDKDLIMEIIMYRVLGYERPAEEPDPKEKKDEK
ncbi:phage tail assembly chaperone G [Enterococcus sp. DIV0876]|uniref:phage tail assembly chaperone G n=1 Tax=Enterococcus sp. DIV0876 TaxID=2774633 RepID=UPI003D3004CC